MTPPSAPLPVAVFVSGRGSNLQALLEAKAAGRLARVRFITVFSDVPSPPAFDHATRHGISTIQYDPRSFSKKSDYEKAVVDALRAFGTEWIVLAGYMRIVGPTLLDAFAGRIINIHPSLLPAFPGLHAQRQAIEAGAKTSGCTVHFVDRGVDTGPVILQRTVPCLPGDTEETLSARILEQEHQALPEALELISEGRVHIENGRVVIAKGSV